MIFYRVLSGIDFCATSYIHTHHPSISTSTAPTAPTQLAPLPTLNFTCINLSSCTKARFCFKLSCIKLEQFVCLAVGKNLGQMSTRSTFEKSMKSRYCLLLMALFHPFLIFSQLLTAAFFHGSPFDSTVS